MDLRDDNDTARFMRIIANLSAADENTARQGRLLPATNASFAEAIVLEVDETVLGRRLLFRNSQGETLSIQAAERRFQAVLDVPPRLQQLAAHVVARPLEEADLSSLAEILRLFCADATELTLVSELLDDMALPDYTGVYCRDVLQALAARSLSALPEPLPRLIAECEPAALSISAFRARQAVLETGVTQNNTGLIDDILDMMDQRVADAGVFLWQGFFAHQAILAARAADTVVCVFLKPQSADDYFHRWHAVLFEPAARPDGG